MLGSARTPVIVRATDPILRDGICMSLQTRDEVWLVKEDRGSGEHTDGLADGGRTVALLVADRLDSAMARLLRSLQAQGFTGSC